MEIFTKSGVLTRNNFNSTVVSTCFYILHFLVFLGLEVCPELTMEMTLRPPLRTRWIRCLTFPLSFFGRFHWPTISALEFFVGEINNPKDILRKLTGWVVE